MYFFQYFILGKSGLIAFDRLGNRILNTSCLMKNEQTLIKKRPCMNYEYEKKPNMNHVIRFWFLIWTNIPLRMISGLFGSPLTLRQVLLLVWLWNSFTSYSNDLCRSLFCDFSRTFEDIFPRIKFWIPSRTQSGWWPLKLPSKIPPKTVEEIFKGSPIISRNISIIFSTDSHRTFSDIPV